MTSRTGPKSRKSSGAAAAGEAASLPPEFLSLRLVRRLRWCREPLSKESAGRENAADAERVVLLLPRFRRGFFARWLQPRLRGYRRFIRIRLDAIGSVVWEACDGETAMETVLERLDVRFGGRERDLPSRLRTFVDRLLREGFVADAEGAEEAPIPADEDSTR